MTVEAEAVVFRYADVPLTCACGGSHGAHYEVRTDTAPSHLVRVGCDHCASCASLDWSGTLAAPLPETVFDGYRAALAREHSRDVHAWTLKAQPEVKRFVENVTEGQGEGYLAALRAHACWSMEAEAAITQAAFDNDRCGAPMRYQSSLGVWCSPTNFRYAWQAVSLLTHAFDTLGMVDVDVLEVGGGYGGLALFATRLAHLLGGRTYRHVVFDLPEAGPIQAAFAGRWGLPVVAVDGSNEHAIVAAVAGMRPECRLFVSAYGFSEIAAELRSWYERLVTAHCAHGFVVWNRSAPYPLAAEPITLADEPVPTESGVKVVTY